MQFLHFLTEIGLFWFLARTLLAFWYCGFPCLRQAGVVLDAELTIYEVRFYKYGFGSTNLEVQF